MKERLPGWAAFLIFLTCTLSVVALLDNCGGTAPAVRAQDRIAQEPPMTDELALARICFSEEGVYVTEGCAAIHTVIQRVARVGHHSYVEAARRYSGRVFDPSRRDERQYIAHLQPVHAIRGRGEPPYWPTQIYRRTRVRGEEIVRVIQHAPWIAFRARWADLLAHAERVIAGEVTHSCELPSVSHWGGRMDRWNADRQALQSVFCGTTHNIFYITGPEYEALGRPVLRGDPRHHEGG